MCSERDDTERIPEWPASNRDSNYLTPTSEHNEMHAVKGNNVDCNSAVLDDGYMTPVFGASAPHIMTSRNRGKAADDYFDNSNRNFDDSGYLVPLKKKTETKHSANRQENWQQGLAYEPGHEKTCIMSYANNKGADQPAHPRSLISAFVVRCLDSVMSLVSVTKIWSLLIASVAEQASLSLTRPETPEDTFSHDEAHIVIL